MGSPDRRPTKIWNRTGPLGETPKRVTDAYPLSDQKNKGGWVKFEPVSDEFKEQGVGPKEVGFGHRRMEGLVFLPLVAAVPVVPVVVLLRQWLGIELFPGA